MPEAFPSLVNDVTCPCQASVKGTRADGLATILLFPAERVAFGVDFVAVQRVAGSLIGGGTLDDWINALRAVEALDFDVVAPGHGALGSKADFSQYVQYFVDLRTGVAEGIAQGKTAEELQASDMLSQYSSLENYQTGRNQNIAQAYQLLQPAG